MNYFVTKRSPTRSQPQRVAVDGRQHHLDENAGLLNGVTGQCKRTILGIER
ncbi:MAG: hypothetical protein LDL41_14715 [Coleofasciculus sp. S288]|nr:hypothetical protein [Coleofasciculus sp. S288]